MLFWKGTSDNGNYGKIKRGVESRFKGFSPRPDLSDRGKRIEGRRGVDDVKQKRRLEMQRVGDGVILSSRLRQDLYHRSSDTYYFRFREKTQNKTEQTGG